MEIYFAHPITTYFSKQAHEALDAIEAKFQDAKIINPAKHRSQEMNYYFNLIESADLIIFMTNTQLLIGKGVFDEIQLAKKLKKEICFYHPLKKGFFPKFSIKRTLEFEKDWKNYARVKEVSFIEK